MQYDSVRPLSGTARQILRLAVVAVSYWLAARLSLSFAQVHGQVTPVWPPTGIALVAFLLIGRQAWPAIALAAFAVNLPLGPSPLGAAVIAIGNTLAPLLAVEVLRRVDFHRELDRLRDAVALVVIGALGGMTISATVGTSVLVLSGAVPLANFWPTWAVWWTGDAMGVLLVAPLLLSLGTRPTVPAIGWRRALELAGLLVATGIATYVLFQTRLGLQYLVLPLIMLAAWRFRLRGSAPAALIASGVAIWSAIQGSGPFFDQTLLQKMVTLQVFNVSVALASFLLACYVETLQRKEEMSRLYTSAQLGSEAKTRFLHMAAHELRTPITVLTGYLSMLSDGSLGPVPDGWRGSLDILMGKTRELNSIVADLLEASQLEANSVPRTNDRLDLRTVVHDASERARPRADLLGAKIATSLPADPVLIDGDAKQLGRILDNLINNGLTYTLRLPRLSVSVASEGARAIVRVADNGAGIPATEQERVFEQFHRTNDPAFRGVAGTGLGLYIGRQLAEGHGGSLAIESSTPEEGTVFVLALPSVAVPAPSQDGSGNLTESSPRMDQPAGVASVA
ncbi:MAG: MASE1 domain-containing protein [Candidatus Dormibacteraeota bacterium]|nr:MASE1 domain-containing protein [Candidatus Dormibacteraeota bacterium]